MWSEYWRLKFLGPKMCVPGQCIFAGSCTTFTCSSSETINYQNISKIIIISPKPPPPTQKKTDDFPFFCRQPSCLGCLVWITFCCLPHGRCGSEGLPISLQCDEPFYRMDFAHGRQSNLATVYRSVPFRPWSRNGDHHLPGLYSRNLPSVLEGCVREFPSGESIQQFEFSLDVEI